MTTVLIYDEAESKRHELRELLEEYGYNVIEAETHETALAAARNHGAIDVLITAPIADDDLSTRLMAEHPNVRVLYVTAPKKAFGRARLLLALLSLTQPGAASGGAWGILSGN
jgi:DNA-binding NtrC family response regulator